MGDMNTDLKAMTASYVHTPLSGTSQQIRLVKIRYQDKTPQLDISIHDLNDAPDYRALSYTWGPPNPSFSINVNGHPFEVRRNLYTFLEKMGRMFASFLTTTPDFSLPYFWIDQICVNQADVVERNSHVRYMSKIYSNADVVFIWLADTTLSSKKDTPPPPTDPTINVTEIPLTTEDIAEILVDPYFSRLWIVQELILSKVRGIYIPGNAAIYFDTVANACTFQRKELADLGVPQSTMAILQDVSWAMFKQGPLGSWIAKYSTQVCAEPRDKVYRFMGLVGHRKRLEVNYDKLVREVYLDAAMLLRDTFLDTPQHWRESQTKYPTEPKDYYDTLNVLAKEMGIDGVELRALQDMLREIWDPEAEFIKVDEQEKPDHPRITDMGFQRKLEAIEAMDVVETDVDQWWYECEVEKHRFTCVVT